ncbi:MAG TPA: NAD-dependent deacylase [Ktedonobacterales bacterium]|nr:NAD-dependent deacylase [Ktedonobacterales bacterium]
MDEPIAPHLLERMRAARRVIALTGAGVSAESGLATFRDPQTGYWSRFNPQELASREGFARDPRRVWAWYLARRRKAREASPNPGHYALARLQDIYPEVVIVTQNIDGLHARAGSRDVVELHGNLARFRCFDEDIPVDYTDPADAPPIVDDDPATWPDVPRCPQCGGMLRPDVVWFGEALPVVAWTRAEECARASDLCLVVGTSAIVYPAAVLPMMARQSGAMVVEINPEPTELTRRAALSLRGPSGEMLPWLVAQIAGGGASA